jgi:hypothetical protein
MNAQLTASLVSLTDSKPMVNITSWHVVGHSLCGVALNHPRLGCREIKSSDIVAFDKALGIVETLNTLYVLDLMNPRWQGKGKPHKYW